MTNYSKELVERMVELVRTAASRYKVGIHDEVTYSIFSDARAIVAELPMPVDPDLIEARKMEAAACSANGFGAYAEQVLLGDCDDRGPVRIRFESIKLGRELERSGS